MAHHLVWTVPQLPMHSPLVQGLPLVQMSQPEVIADNEVPGPEPENFWDPVHSQVKRMTEALHASAVIVLEDDPA